MHFSKLYKVAHRITMAMLLLLLGNNVVVNAQQGTTNREVLRRTITVDKLILNLENPKRDKVMQPDRVVDIFGVKKGESVADVGAGTGYFTFRLASRVGVEGKVYAVEIEDEMLSYVRKKMEKDNVTNIIQVKPSGSDPNLPPACCDKILVVNTYNFISEPVTFLTNIRKALKPGGSVAIIDIDASKVKSKKKISLPAEVIEEMKRAGFALRESHNFLASRYYLVFN